MPIIPPQPDRPGQPDPRPLVTAYLNRHGEYEITVHPGAVVEDIRAAVAQLPAEAVFTDHYGDVRAVLVFRPLPAAPPADRPDRD